MGVVRPALLVILLSFLAINIVHSASLFSAFSRSFGTQEEVTNTVIRRGNGYEERQYPSRKWVCTNQTKAYGDQIEEVKVFLKLFEYLDGENDQKRTLKMGVPVSIEYVPKEEGDKFTVCFALEDKDLLNLPEPTNPEVKIIQRPEMTVFTRKFGGWATSESDWKKAANKLESVLQNAKEGFRTDVMYWNAYNAPFVFWNRRNEVWLVKA